MSSPISIHPEFDVVIVGTGIAGALAAHRLVQSGIKVLMIEAGGVAPDSVGRYEMVRQYTTSPTKTPDSPFCGDNILALQPNSVPSSSPKAYYEYSPASDMFKSQYERLVGGSTWHWQGIFIRMLPSDFHMSQYKLDGVNDWPIDYDDLEPYYVQAEYEMGVAGNDRQIAEFFEPQFQAYRSKPFPMPELVPSYLDAYISDAVRRVPAIDGRVLRVTNVPHAINSQPFDGRPACDGHTSCVPLCPTKARYEAITHVEKAIRLGAVLRTQAVVTRIELNESRTAVTRVWYKRWSSQTNQGTTNYTLSQEQSVTGRYVVLAANAIENPMILLRSNVANSSDSVGCYLMDHPIKQSYALSSRPLFPFRGPQTTSDIENFRDGNFRNQFAAFKTSIKNDGWSTVAAASAPRGNVMPPPPQGRSDSHPGTLLDFVHNFGYFGTQLRNKVADHASRQFTLNSACEQLPIKSNRVSLSKTSVDQWGLARPYIEYKLDDSRGYVSKSFAKIVQVHDAIFKAMGIPENDRFLQDDGTKTWGGSGHIMGTTIMGNNPKNSVVNKDCRTHDHVNLYILGSSVFPTGSTANPTSTIAALALRAADTIAKLLKKTH